MRIFVKAKTKSKEQKVERIDENNFVVSVKEEPVKGMANKAIINALSEYFSVPKYSVVIKAGHYSSSKIIEVLGI